MRRRQTYNPKRRIRTFGDDHRGKVRRLRLVERLLSAVDYGGNPEHKRDPGDFGLTPPANPRRDKTLCDGVNIRTRKEAVRLLQAGIRRGLISEQTRGEYPQNIWSVTEEGVPLEAQLENVEQGIYHGYPIPETDPFREEVLARVRIDD